MKDKYTKITVMIGALLTIILSAVCLWFEPWCSLICFLLGTFLIALFVFFSRNRRKKLEELNNYLSKVCSGNFDLNIGDNAEGELSILKNNLFKVITILRKQNECLENDKTFLADSLADISHQLKTPLTSMMVMTDLLREEKNEVKREEFVSVIEERLEKMKWLITNLLKMSKLDAGTIVLKREKCSSHAVIEASIKPFLLMLELKDISLENTAEEFDLNIDVNWTAEAMQNIIKNCIEHTEHGGKLKIRSERTNIYDSVIISDNGCGISEEDLPHIFERFYRGKNSSTESVGIGLALAKSITEKENAVVNVKSVEGEGTEFEVRFYKSII